jgi:cytolysin-activating lysine-acyltransferase
VTGVTAKARDLPFPRAIVAREAEMPEDRFLDGDGPGPEVVERFRRLGEVLWLLRRSPRHAGWEPGQVERNLLHPLVLGQARVFHRRDMPVGLATWAWLDATAAKVFASEGHVPPEGWRSGTRFRIVDFVAPFGDARAIARDLRELLPAEDVSRALRRCTTRRLRPSGTGLSIEL